MSNPFPPGRSALYRLYDADDQLLYIGISKDPDLRFQKHAGRSPWWPKVARQSIEWLDDRQSALDVERRLIEELNPPYNSNWNTDEIKRRIGNEQYVAQWDAIKADLEANPPEWMKTGQFLPDE